MKKQKIVIAGGSGFIGQALIEYFGSENQIVVLTREIPGEKTNACRYIGKVENHANVRFVKWDGVTPDHWQTELEESDVLINLAGKTVNCRYTEKNKSGIFSSRINATKVLGLAVQHCVRPPKLWINAASATIYRHADDHPQDEYNGEYKNDFSVQVCKLWEKTFFDQRTPFTRKIALRMAITLGTGGVMIPYFNMLKFGLGGRQGSGEQMYSWIHIEDTCRMIDWIWKNEQLEGIFNCSSPEPVTNKFFMDCLRKVTNTNFSIPAPEWLLKLGAKLIGTETELILKSRWVIPTKIIESGFTFKYEHLESAFKNLVSTQPKKMYKLL